ncbi:endonuclease/exonuclease/phosphatase family domain-containing protein 1-like [Anneissia japonica]|uniref:endonuclease/exonuclease/phosphatase family domain-containing protein 1-like n=1 Tax=Anneissia japonica TaxID=1529436 RepID=UPI0014259A3F|nr:endonuclease/exonuclease/phosphatase family domain-containing protein 1-like [Anneissia japonica]XP_033117223.1 endonuclease/exonuclease/phosphatase family domain-containing protein 1-like [Anneissia japonica]
MGAVTSCCGRRPKKSRLRTKDECRPSKRGHRRQLSAAYNASEFTMDQLDINQACEEELMNLDGISRNVARNIIQYRNYIGGFRKVEDLALVSGVGALKLENFRTDIYCGEFCCSPSRTQRPNLSRVPSWTRWSTYSKCNSVDKVDINTASLAQIAQIRGVRENVAEEIVNYRNENGPFQVLSELSHLPSVGTYLFDRIRGFLTIGDTVSVSVSTTSTPVSVAEQGDLFQGSANVSCSTQTPPKQDRIPVCLCHTGLAEDYKWKVNIEKHGRPVIRIASWNLGQYTLAKCRNLGVKEVIVRTILENGFGLIAVQDIREQHVLVQLCLELNKAVESLGQHGNWRSVTSDPVYAYAQGHEYSGFIWNADALKLEDSSLLASSFKLPQSGTPLRWPFLGCFRVGQIEISVVNIHVASSGSHQTSLLQRLWGGYSSVSLLSQAVSAELHDDENLVILGDFDCPPFEDDFDVLRLKGFQNMLAEYEYTDISLDNVKGSQCQDNIWINHTAGKLLTGNTGICRENLTHPLIPNGWSLNGVVSNSCPIWADMYTAITGGDNMSSNGGANHIC